MFSNYLENLRSESNPNQKICQGSRPLRASCMSACKVIVKVINWSNLRIHPLPGEMANQMKVRVIWLAIRLGTRWNLRFDQLITLTKTLQIDIQLALNRINFKRMQSRLKSIEYSFIEDEGYENLNLITILYIGIYFFTL